jgi:hypothetical protein
MKMTKLASVALSAALLFGAASAGAQSGPTIVGYATDFMPLQFNWTWASQNPTINTKGSQIWGFGKVKITNKDILAMLANALNVTWPVGTQLEYVFHGNYYENAGVVSHSPDAGYQLAVADYTGTNIYFFAGDGINYDYAKVYFDLDPFDYDGVYQGSETMGSTGTYTYGESYLADWEFYADFNYNNDFVASKPKVAVTPYGYWDLFGGGSTTETYLDQFTPNTDVGSDQITMSLVGAGYNGYGEGENDNNFITGTVQGIERWASFNLNRRTVAALVHKH